MPDMAAREVCAVAAITVTVTIVTAIIVAAIISE